MLSIVSGFAPERLRGTAFGIFYTVMAATAVAANTLFGTIWTNMGAQAAFGLSAAITSVTLLAFPSILPEAVRKPKSKNSQQATAAEVPTPLTAPAAKPIVA
jgi:MFS family permease